MSDKLKEQFHKMEQKAAPVIEEYMAPVSAEDASILDANSSKPSRYKLIVDTDISNQTSLLVKNIAPYLDLPSDIGRDLLDNDTEHFLKGMHFFKLSNCSVENKEDLANHLNETMNKLFSAIYSFGEVFAYGIVSSKENTDLILGVKSGETQKIVESVLKGLLIGIELDQYCYNPNIIKYSNGKGGTLSAVPVLKINDEPQHFDISPIMRSLYGQNYILLFIAKPCSEEDISSRYNEIVKIRDECFSKSKRSLSQQTNESIGKAHTDSNTKSINFGAMASVSLFDRLFNVGGYIGGAFTNSKSDTTTQTTGSSDTISGDVQNGFAVELMKYCDRAIERFQQGKIVGMWRAAISYCAENDNVANIISACLNSQLAKPVTDLPPLRHFCYSIDEKCGVRFPKTDIESNDLLVPITSNELGKLCTLPYDVVPEFEIRKNKYYPMVSHSEKNDFIIGTVSDGIRPLDGMEFSLSREELNKHTFVCGITGSGKTTTVKKILSSCDVPFMVIESAKKEYRKMKLDKTVYTLGIPEINCLQFNPFFVQMGINVQTHIDFLKDLFNASFSFYGPMPYILEKCLQNIYKKKGWNLTLGYHPCLINSKNYTKAFDSEYQKEKYKQKALKYLFPTMEDLKAEVRRYIDEELQYDGEVKGNVKTAMLARLESMCVGSKGFMLNTPTPIDMDSLLQNNTIFELDGLSDDSDKAFCVGLLIIFIKEYRQVYAELNSSNKTELRHLLVIEEAHRLLKNVETERTSENMGNPKGKAVEHFTNMLAEMRSYGQGVIIAEQIPSKLAPDVIKNSSNKIVQRVISADDQMLVANTIGIDASDAIYLGNLQQGQALCHKEGMSLPVFVQIDKVEDDQVTDKILADKRNGDMFIDINRALIRENSIAIMHRLSLHILNAILSQSPESVHITIKTARNTIRNELRKNDVTTVFNNDKIEKIIGEVLLEGVVRLLVSGVYRVKSLVSDKLYDDISSLVIEDVNLDDSDVPECAGAIDSIRNELEQYYKQDPRNRCKEAITNLILVDKRLGKNTNIRESILTYFSVQDVVLVNEIETMIKERR